MEFRCVSNRCFIKNSINVIHCFCIKYTSDKSNHCISYGLLMFLECRKYYFDVYFILWKKSEIPFILFPFKLLSVHFIGNFYENNLIGLQ